MTQVFPYVAESELKTNTHMTSPDAVFRFVCVNAIR